MALLLSTWRRATPWLCSLLLLVVAAACTGDADGDEVDDSSAGVELEDPPRRYRAEWLIDSQAVELDDLEGSFLYREAVDDQTGQYLIQSPNHLALQNPESVVFCAAINRFPLDPYCAARPRAEGAPNVLSFPIQLLSEWGPRALYDLAGYREVSLVAESDPDNWGRRDGIFVRDIPIECFLVTGTTTAAATGFEICFTDDDLHLVASVDLQNDLTFEIDLVNYERGDISEEFDTGLDDFFEERPSLQDQLLELYPEIPAARPTPTATPGEE